MSSSSSSVDKIPPGYFPLITPKRKEETKKDWIKIGAIVAAVVGGLIVALSVLCIFKFFPLEMLGGPVGLGITLIVGAAILLPAAYVLFDKWQNASEWPT